ncbi:RNA-guided endonuclease InsQ/TnpB family protein [Streptomyces sp. NPDC058375]|uniref:RNA-guided endonuclease InsQ/TnpB family protein n=1 Tax=Streptomyces sp. NPDC058375 TaxID=3346467 RepID=UPI00365A0377
MATNHVKRAFKYRFHPTDAQAAELSRTFGCVRKVYNLALAARTEAGTRQKRVDYNQTSAMLTVWKKTEELAYLSEVSSVPLQQCLRHLQTAFTNFFGKRAKYPRFKSKRKSRKSAEYTTSGFRFRDGKLTLAKMREPLDIVWSPPLPDGTSPSTVTVSQDAAGRWFVSMLCDDTSVKPLPTVDMAVGIDVGLTHLLTLSTGELQDKMPLNVRTWTCDCGTTHDRDVNAAENLLAAGRAVEACGAGVRPQRVSPGGQSVMKQEVSRREL